MRGVLTGSFFSLAIGMLAACAAAEPAKQPAYRVLAQDRGHVAIVTSQGEPTWEVECKHNSHDIALLANGNLLLHTGPATVAEMTPAKLVVWQYTASPLSASSGKVEIHAFQRLPDGLTMVAGSDALRFHSPVPLTGRGDLATTADFTMRVRGPTKVIEPSGSRRPRSFVWCQSPVCRSSFTDSRFQ